MATRTLFGSRFQNAWIALPGRVEPFNSASYVVVASSSYLRLLAFNLHFHLTSKAAGEVFEAEGIHWCTFSLASTFVLWRLSTKVLTRRYSENISYRRPELGRIGRQAHSRWSRSGPGCYPALVRRIEGGSQNVKLIFQRRWRPSDTDSEDSRHNTRERWSHLVATRLGKRFLMSSSTGVR